jgi:hypothetical protein
MTNHQFAITISAIAVIAAMMISVPVASALPQKYFQEILSRSLLVPVAVSGNNIYAAWNNASAALHGVAIFFTKSNDGGKTFSKTMVLSPPNTNPKIDVVYGNVSLSASGSNVVVTWWTNATGALNPVMRTSSDGGNTFANLIRLNSTSGGINK